MKRMRGEQPGILKGEKSNVRDEEQVAISRNVFVGHV